MAHTTRDYRRRPRPGFTLIEILVVIAIIGVLFSLGTAAYQRIRIGQTVKATEDVVGKLQGGVDDQLKVLADNVRGEKQNGSAEFGGLMSYCGNDKDRTAALLLYLRIKQNFPQTTAELTSTTTTAPGAGKQGFTFPPLPAVGGVNFPLSPGFNKLASVTGTADQIAAACLYVAMTERTIGGKVFDSDTGTSGRHLDIVVTGGTVRAYRDAWDQPIAFVRFHQSAELNQAPYTNVPSALKDPFDTLGKLAQSWANKTAAEAFFGFGPGTLFNNANKSVLVYSVGRNATLDGFGGDDVIGYKLRIAGARGAAQP